MFGGLVSISISILGSRKPRHVRSQRRHIDIEPLRDPRGRKARRQHIDEQLGFRMGRRPNAFWLPLRLTRGRVTIEASIW
jgi:hypothetical protein